MWRHETHGSFMLLLNTVLHFDHLQSGRNEPAAGNISPGSTPSSSSWRRPTVGGPSFSPDGSKVLFTSDASGISNAYTVPFEGGRVDAAHPLDHRLDLRASRTSPRTSASSTPTTRAGDENNHLYVARPDGRDAT